MRRARTTLSLSLLLAAPGATALGQSSGSIYTTNQTGSVVNGNLYSSKNHVYLTGGPGVNSSCSSPGLPDGAYYFQVTNPSGSVLLSTDGIESRKVLVTSGKVSAYIGSPPTHSTKNNGPCGAKLVQLAPFADSPSSSGECKLWVTKVENFDPGGSGFFGFVAKFSKTDNFKIKGPGPSVTQSLIQGFKFYDFNENGVHDPAVPEEVPIPGWKIELYKDGILDGVNYTNDAGEFTFIRNLDNTTYLVREVAPPPGFIPAPGGTWLAMTPTEQTVVANASVVPVPDFGNLAFVVALGAGRSKGFWHNQGEPLLADCDPAWREALNGTPASPVCLRTSVSSLDPSLSIFLVPPVPAPFATAFDAWADYIVGDPALGHGGFILSSQVAASILNNTCGFMQGTIYVDRFLDGVLVDFQAMKAGAIGLLCDPNAGLTGPNDPFQELRQAMLNCSNEFANINESGDLSNPQPVHRPSESPTPFESPF